jgi:hypothetical protein
VTAWAAPSSLVMISCSIRVNLTNESRVRHTIVSAITQLLDSVGHFRIVPSIGCDAVTHPSNGNHGANYKLLKIRGLIDRFIARVRKFAKVCKHVF